MGSSSNRNDQFPQPTRPRFAADPDQLTADGIIINRQVHHSILHPHVTVDVPSIRAEIPPPPPPPPSFDSWTSSSTGETRTVEPPPACYPTGESSSSSSSAMEGNRPVHLSPSTGKTPKGEREAVDELLLILVDCLDELSTRSREVLLLKFFSEIEREERLEKFIAERLQQTKVKALTDLYHMFPPEFKAEASSVEGDVQMSTTSARSVVESAEELTEKLERFKMTTLDFGEEEEEDKKKSQEKSTK